MTLLNRESIRDIQDVGIEEVEVPEWGGSVYVRGMTLADMAEHAERQRQLGANPSETELAGLLPAIVVRYCVDPAGVRIFQDEDEAWLRTKSVASLKRIVDAFNVLNGFDEIQEEDTLQKK